MHPVTVACQGVVNALRACALPGCRHSCCMVPSFFCRKVPLALCIWITWIRRMANRMYNRSRALRQLPGPGYPWLTGMWSLLASKEPHRRITELAEEFGPIFKLRLLAFHVSQLVDSCVEQAPSLATGNLWVASGSFQRSHYI